MGNMAQQSRLRQACLRGDLASAQTALQSLTNGAWLGTERNVGSCCAALLLSFGRTAIRRITPWLPCPLQAADPLHTYGDDGNSTVLHYCCSGSQVGPVARVLLFLPAGVRPAPHDAERAALLSWLLEKHPLVALLACTRDARGDTAKLIG